MSFISASIGLADPSPSQPKRVPARARMRKPSQALSRILAENIIRYRKRMGISQEELAFRSGLHRTYIGSVERCERNVTLSTLEVLGKALGITVPALLTRGPHDESD